MKQRIWELDAFRGICILGMVIVHLTFDLVYLYGTLTLGAFGDALYNIVTQWGGVLFLLLSGICVTLGSHPVKRGLLVFSCGMLCTLVTAGMYFLQLQSADIIIYFGVLHCLGVCMLLWPLMKKLPLWLLAVLGAIIIALGFYFQTILLDTPFLIPFGILYPGFSSSDYFPLFPNLGFFLLGAVLGKTVYRKQQSLLPGINPDFFLIRFFRLCGRYSLIIYLLHQPLITVALEAFL